MDIEFLVQIRQSNKCGRVKIDEIFDVHLGSAAGPIPLSNEPERSRGFVQKQPTTHGSWPLAWDNFLHRITTSGVKIRPLLRKDHVSFMK